MPTSTPAPGTAGPPAVGGTDAGMRAPAIPAGAVSIAPGQRAAAIVSSRPAGTTFVFEPGVHRGVTIRPRDGDRFLGRSGAILSGAAVLRGFAARDGYWAAGGQRSELFGAGGCEVLADGSRYRACVHPEQLFVDGETWRQVSELSELGPGRWFFDYGRDRVYVGADPAGRAVELSTTAHAFVGTARDVRIAGLVIERYANRARTGAIEAGGSSGWTVEANELRFNHGFGLRIGHGMRVLDNYVHRNGQVGLGGIGNDVLVAGNEIAYNHTGGFLEAWEAGATKFVLTRNLVFRENWVHHNRGRGVWTDIDNVDALIEHNLVEWNTHGGIVHEISYDAVIRDNIARHNGLGFGVWVWGAQILVQNSADVIVTGNDVTVSAAGGNGIAIVNQERGVGPRGPYRSNRVTVSDNTIRHLGLAGRNGAPNGCHQTNTFDRNRYEAPARWFERTQFEWCGLRTWEQFRDLGQEPNGVRISGP